MAAPVELSRRSIAWAVAVKRGGSACPLCAVLRCRCTVRELAEFRERQGVFAVVEEHEAPAMPAAPGGQGRLF